MATKKKSKKKTKGKPGRRSPAVLRKYKHERTRAFIRRRFLEDATNNYRPEVEAMRAVVEELAGDDDFWDTMERVAKHIEWRPSARRVSR